MIISSYFAGAYVNGIDAKHRLSVPASLRDTVEARSGTKAVVLAPSEYADCLVGYDITHYDRIRARLEEQFSGDFGPGRSRKARSLFGLAVELKYDDTGRIILTQALIDGAGLEKQAVFLGAGDYFELWHPEKLLADAEDDPVLARTVRALLAGRK